MAFRVLHVSLFALGTGTASVNADFVLTAKATAFLGSHPVSIKGEFTDRVDFGDDAQTDDKLPQTTSWVAKAEERLRPIFATLSLNKHNLLGSAGVRYLMHRYFVKNHAWFMRGLLPDREEWGSFPVERLLGDSSDVVAMRKRIRGDGLSLSDTAELAKMLWGQVRSDAKHRLEKVWEGYGLQLEEKASARQLYDVLDMHIGSYIMPEFWKSWQFGRFHSFDDFQRDIEWSWPTWRRTQTFLRRTAQEFLPVSSGVNFKEANRVVMHIVDRFGRWQDDECDDMKRKLISLESRPGRVDLPSFYGEALRDAKYMFNDSIPYLRSLGALDEADPEQPLLIIPNYIASAANHIGESRDFELGCIDDCMGLLEHIENRIGTPAASPDEIVRAVRSIPLDVAAVEKAKLGEIAAVNSGLVPLHSRLFSLWIHRLSPRECPYPHQAGTTRQLQYTDFETLTHMSSVMDPADMLSFVEKARSDAGENSVTTTLPWDTHEEVPQELGVESAKAGREKSWKIWCAILALGYVGIALVTLIARRKRPQSTASASFLDVCASSSSAASPELAAQC